MFATLRCGPDEEPLVAIQETNQLPAQGQGHQHQACYYCREKKLKCSAQKTGCDRCAAQGIVCTFRRPNGRRDSRTPQKRGGGTANIRRNEASRPSLTSKNTAPTGLAIKSNPAQTNNNIGTNGASTPSLTSDNCSASSSVAGMQTPQTKGRSLSSPDDLWQLSSMGSGSATLAPGLSGADFEIPCVKSPNGLEDFSGDTEFDAFQFEQDEDRFSDIMDLDLGFSGFLTKDELEMSMIKKTSTLERGDGRTAASSLPSPQEARLHSFPVGPQQSSWADFDLCKPKVTFGSEPMQCNCLTVTLSLIEKVHFREPHASASTLIQLLHEFKQWINFLKGVAGCTACNCVNESLMLLVVVCEKLADSFDIVLSVYEKLAEAMRDTSGGRSEIRILSGDYRIDSVEEFACLFKSLALRHLQSLQIITLYLDKRAAQGKMTRHHELLQRLDNRYRLMKETLRQAHLKGS